MNIKKSVLWIVVAIIGVAVIFGITWLGINWKKITSKSELYTHEEYLQYGEDRYQAGVQQGELYKVQLTECQRKLAQIESENSKLIIQVNTLKNQSDADAELISRYEEQILTFDQERTELSNEILRLQALLKAFEEMQMTMRKIEYFDGEKLIQCDYEKEGETIKLTDYIPKKQYHSFDGWVTTDGVAVTSETIIETDLVLIPSFSWQAGIYDYNTNELIMSWKDMLNKELIEFRDNVLVKGANVYDRYIDKDRELSICVVDEDIKIGGAFIFLTQDTSVANGRYACVKKIIMTDSITDLPNRAFAGMEYLEEIRLSRNIKSIGNYAFNGCEKLKEIDLPIGLTTLGENIFESCKSLTNITIPGSVKIVNSLGMFLDRLESLVLLDGVETINDRLFSASSSQINPLRYIYLPASISEIPSQLFWAAYDLNQKYDIYLGWESMLSSVSEFTWGPVGAHYETHLGISYQQFLDITGGR